MTTVRPHTLANLVDGRPTADAERSTPILDPATEQPLTHAPLSRAPEVDAAVAAALRAFDDWRYSTPARRSEALYRVADALQERAVELTDLECRNTGKPRAVTLAEEVEPTIDQLRFFAGAARVTHAPAAGEYLAGHTSVVRREPVGVCAQIAPWNYPLMMAVWKVGPALAAGNTVVLKPAETTPMTSLLLAEIAAEHLPPGVLNVVCGDRDTGRLLVAHPDTALVSLTGSTRAGREVAGAAGLKRLHLELGGNAAALVLDDADVELAAREIAAAAYVNAGQDCVAASRVLAGPRVADDLTAALVEQARATRVGGPDDPTADYGPLNNADQLARVCGLVERLPDHAQVLIGGHRLDGPGYFYPPTVVTGVRQDDEIVREEIFGPVLTVQRFTTEAEGIALANGVSQGLACSVWTRDHAAALRCARAMDSGCVWINTHLRFAAEMPHGGYKESGYGKDLSAYALDDYSRVKHVMTAV